MRLIPFLVLAALVTAAIMGLLGGWLLPAVGVQGRAATLIAGGLAGAVVATLYFPLVRPQG